MLLIIRESMVTSFGFHLNSFLLGIDSQGFTVDLGIVEKWLKFLKLSIF